MNFQEETNLQGENQRALRNDRHFEDHIFTLSFIDLFNEFKGRSILLKTGQEETFGVFWWNSKVRLKIRYFSVTWSLNSLTNQFYGVKHWLIL